MKNRRLFQWIVLAILACAALYLVGNGRVALWDRDEPWYAQCTLKMIQTGDYAVPKYLDGRLRTEKPPLVYWLQSVPMRLLQSREFAPRLVSSLAMTLALVLLAFAVWRMAGPRRAAWTVLIFGTSALTIAAGKMCLTDAVLMCSLIPVQFALLDFYRGRGSFWHGVVFALGCALGGLTKGPIVFVTPATTLVVLAVFDFKRWSSVVRQQPLDAMRVAGKAGWVVLGVVLAAAIITGPWLYVNYQRDPRWLVGTLHTAQAHLAEAQDSHSGFPVPGWYFVMMWATYFPWSLLVPTAAVIAWKHRRLPEIRFAMAAILGTWLFHELCMKTKLPHYMLSTYPFMAFLTADTIVRCLRGQYDNLVRPFTRYAVLVWALLIGGIPSLVWFTAQKHLGFPNLPYAAMVTLSLFGYVYTLGVWWLFQRRRPAAALGWMGAGYILLVGIAYAWYVPNARFIGISRDLAAIMRQEQAVAGPQQKKSAGTLIYHLPKAQGGSRTGWEEPSLEYYQGGTLRKIMENRFLELHEPQEWPDVMVITPAIWDMSPAAVQKQLEVIGKVRGLAYEGRLAPVELWVVRKVASAQAAGSREPLAAGIGQ